MDDDVDISMTIDSFNKFKELFSLEIENKKSFLYKISFKTQDMGIMENLGKFDYIYSRFSIHAISNDAEKSLLNWIKNSLEVMVFSF